MPTWSILHSRHWKGQIPDLARHFRVVTFDGRGNGRSDRRLDPPAYAGAAFVGDAIAVLDATGTEQRSLAGLSMGAGLRRSVSPASIPSASSGSVLIGAGHRPRRARPAPARCRFEVARWTATTAGRSTTPTTGGATGRASSSSSSARSFNEPHSTKQIEDGSAGRSRPTPRSRRRRGARTSTRPRPRAVRTSRRAGRHQPGHCPTLVIHGDRDPISRPASDVGSPSSSGRTSRCSRGAVTRRSVATRSRSTC